MALEDVLRDKLAKTIQESNTPLASKIATFNEKQDKDKSLITQQSTSPLLIDAVKNATTNVLGSQAIFELPVTLTINGKKTPVYYNYNSNNIIYKTNNDTGFKEVPIETLYNAKQDILKVIKPYTTGKKSFGLFDAKTTQKLANNLYNLVDGYQKNSLQQYEQTIKNNGGGGGNTTVNYYGKDYSGEIDKLTKQYEQMIKDYRQTIDELKNPKVWTAEELAKQFNVEDSYNVDYWKNLYDTKTNKYYNDIIAEQNKVNDQNNTSNSNYAARLLNKYVDSYRNAAPTAMGRGTLAANALMQNLGATAINEEYATNLNNIVNDYKQQWNAELANNPTLARDTYNTIGQWLINRGVATNTAEVQNYINHLTAYDTAYSGIRNAQVNLAKTAADAYSNNAQAALAKNQAAANGAKDNALIEAYKLKYGTDTNNWAVALNNDNHDVAIKYGLTYNNK